MVNAGPWAAARRTESSSRQPSQASHCERPPSSTASRRSGCTSCSNTMTRRLGGTRGPHSRTAPPSRTHRGRTRRTDLHPAHPTRATRPRRRRPHHPRLPPASGRHQPLGLHHLARSQPSRTDHAPTQEAPTIQLHPFRSRPTQPVLASRLHPLETRQRHRHQHPAVR